MHQISIAYFNSATVYAVLELLYMYVYMEQKELFVKFAKFEFQNRILHNSSSKRYRSCQRSDHALPYAICKLPQTYKTAKTKHIPFISNRCKLNCVRKVLAKILKSANISTNHENIDHRLKFQLTAVLFGLDTNCHLSDAMMYGVYVWLECGCPNHYFISFMSTKLVSCPLLLSTN